ncbi:formylmethanofuran dehydrogenase subunit E family protein [Candidatus Omnitrophota bacterium]
MSKNRVTLEEAEKFHGHLGPYLILGIIAGDIALNNLRCKKYFGLEVKVWGVNRKPKSCLVDGLQLSTGATYGKGNIIKLNSPMIKIEFTNCKNRKKIVLRCKGDLMKKLESTKNHRDCESLARRLYSTDCGKLFNLQLTT